MHLAAFILLVSSFWVSGCAPRVMRMEPSEGRPGTVVSLSMEYLVGWPRVEIGGKTMDYYQVRLLGLNPTGRMGPTMNRFGSRKRSFSFECLVYRPAKTK